MTVETTGSSVPGLIDGMKNATTIPIQYVNGNPDGVVTCIAASGLGIDVANGAYYISKTAGGSTWYNLGSIAAE